MTGRQIAAVAVAMTGALAGAFVLGIYTPVLLAPSRARRLIESMEAQQGGNYARQAEALLALGPGAIQPLLDHGLSSRNEWVRNTSVEVLDVLGWQHVDGVDLVEVFRGVAADTGESPVVRQTAARACFHHVGGAPEGWEAFLTDEGHLRFSGPKSVDK